jgi:hypothetical protein
MTARELLQSEIDNLDEQSVSAVLQLVRLYAKSSPTQRSGDLLTMLRTVEIDGPADFAANLDEYLYGGDGAGAHVS